LAAASSIRPIAGIASKQDSEGKNDYRTEHAAKRTKKMPAHRFAIGQSVRLRGRFGMPLDAAEVFRITATLPARDNSPQYRMRNDEERHERVTTEDNLEEVEMPAAKAGSKSER
jgi:hypothetical protein